MKENKTYKKEIKGQAEIIGLILITVIGGLAIAFGLVYMYTNSTKPLLVHETFGERVISTNFVSVLAKTYVPECNTDYFSVVKDCVTNYDSRNPRGLEQGTITCTDPAVPGPEGDHLTCYYVNQTATQILKNSLQAWGLSYRFTIQKIGESLPVIEEVYMDCTSEKEKEAPGRHIIPLFPTPGEAFIILEVCKT